MSSSVLSADPFASLGLTIPALRGEQGGRKFYLSLPSNGILTGIFPTEIEGSEDRSQRPLDPNHARQIRDYVVSNRVGYALGALVFASDQDGTFEEVAAGSGIGILRLPLDARLSSIDGQHRREGVRQALQAVPDLQRQSTAVIIYVEPDLTRRRQMFSDMNNTARKVSKALNVSYDSRDPFARAASALSAEHPLLTGRVERSSPRVLAGSGNLYTLAGVYDALKRLFVGPIGRVKDPARFADEQIMSRGAVFFDALARSRPELGEDRSSGLDALRLNSILLSSTTLRVIASAVWTAGEDRGVDNVMFALPTALASVDFSPGARLWQDSGFVSAGRSTPNARTQEMKAASDLLARSILAMSGSHNKVAK